MTEAVPASADLERDQVVAELAVVRALLAGRDTRAAQQELGRLRAISDEPGRLDVIESAFGLSPFERQVLLLAAGPDLVGEVGHDLLEFTGQPRLTFAAALARLPEAHWDALTHRAPLRGWSLLRVTDAADSVLTCPLLIDERIVHFLAGVDVLDERLELLSAPVAPPFPLPASYASIAGEILDRWSEGSAVVLRGPQPRTVRAIAAACCHSIGLGPRLIAAADLPTSAAALAPLVRRLVRETVLARVGWLLDLDDAPRILVDALGKALTGSDAPVVLLASSRPGALSLDGLAAPVLEVPRLSAGERRDALAMALRSTGMTVADAEVEAAAGAFDLALPDLEAVAVDVLSGHPLWAACRRRPRAEVGSLAHVRHPSAAWEQLVLPEPQLAQLHALAAAVRHRPTVLDDWGFGVGARGRGTTALFSGDSGTGKTFAAEVIAHELDLDLVQVDLSQIVDKYLGETEKRLAQLFDAAEDGGMVLLFDEADALFGKRTEVKDSHDRYANVEVGYLLQRLEAFAGLAILTTNARSALDPAFTRRLSMIVDFPYPDKEARLRMWRQSIPTTAPTADLDLDRLADSDLSGGPIAAALLQAANLAADSGGQLTMEHLRRAMAWELAKTGRVTTGMFTR